MDKVFILNQVFTNPRDNSVFFTSHGEYPTLAEAKKAAKRDKLKRWAIVEQKIVARSPE